MLRAVKTICVGGGGAGAVNTLSRMRGCMYVCPRERELCSHNNTKKSTMHAHYYNIKDLSEYSNALAIRFGHKFTSSDSIKYKCMYKCTYVHMCILDLLNSKLVSCRSFLMI